MPTLKPTRLPGPWPRRAGASAAHGAAPVLATLVVALLLSSACRPLHLVAPPSPAPGGPPRLRAPREAPGAAATFPGGVRLGRFTLEAEPSVATARARAAFRDALDQALVAAFPARAPAESPLTVDVTYRVAVHRESSLALDLLSTLTLGLLFITPEQGLALVEVTLAPRGPPRRALHLTVIAPWRTPFTPWFARDATQRRLDHAHRVAFRRIVARLRAWGAEARALTSRPTPVPTETSTPTPRPPPTPSPAPRAAPSPAPRAAPSPAPAPAPRWYQVFPRLHGVRLWQGEERSPTLTLTREVVRAEERVGTLGTLLGLLGGVSVGYAYGSAWVSSQVRDATGRRQELASGRGVSHGAGFALSAPPRHSGLYFYPTVGFLWQQITIADPAGLAAQAGQEHAQDIPAVATDPLTGAPVDLAAAWGYQLTMTSLYLGPRLGLALVLGTRTAFYLSVEGGLNLLEWRYTHVRWDQYRADGHRFAAAESFAGRAVLGLVHRPWHVGLQCQAGVEYFRQFRYPEAIPFRGPVVYDASLAAFQRPVQWARAASLRTVSLHCGLMAFY